MKPWLINLIAIVVMLGIAFGIKAPLSNLLTIIITISSAIWAYTDAKKINISNYQKQTWSVGNSPGFIALAVLLLWIVAFPLYITSRQKILDGKVALKNASGGNPSTTPATPQSPTNSAPPVNPTPPAQP